MAMSSQGNGQPLLRVDHVTVHFAGLTALESVDLDVKAGGIAGVIGPNGAGKTTLFNTIAGYIAPTTGSIIFKGEEILGLAAHDIAKKGLIRTFQLSEVFPEMSVLENVMTGYNRLAKGSLVEIVLGLRNAKKEERRIRDEALEILETFHLAALAEQMTGDLSYGQQRLVEISRALVSKPDLLLLDEPAAGLSTSERSELNRLLRSICREKGVDILLTDHSMDFVMDICDRISVLNYGQKIAEGTPGEIQRNEKVVEIYLGNR